MIGFSNQCMTNKKRIQAGKSAERQAVGGGGDIREKAMALFRFLMEFLFWTNTARPQGSPVQPIRDFMGFGGAGFAP